ncbi:MAG: hypothetical protein ACUVWR_07935 [Anaerolineae bacterium]
MDNALDLLYRYPLQEQARERLNRQLRLGLDPSALLGLVEELARDNRLVRLTDEPPVQEPVIVCSMGLIAAPGG